MKIDALKNFAKFADFATLLKKRLWHRCFPVNFAKFSRTPFLQNTSERLLLIGSDNKYLRFPKLFLGNKNYHLCHNKQGNK